MVDDGRRYNLSAEQSVLGCVLCDPQLVPRVLSRVGVLDFSLMHQPWVMALGELFQSGRKIDPVTVLSALQTADPQDNAQRRKYAAELLEITVTTANLDLYLDLIAQKSRLRRLWDTADQVLATPVEEGMAQLVERMASILSDHKTTDVEDMSTGMNRFFDRHESGVEPDFLKTSIPKLDQRVHIRPGYFVVIGAEPSAGKTLLALQMALEAGKSRRVGFFSLETDHDTLMDRMVANYTGISFGKIQRNQLSSQEWAQLAAAADPFGKLSLDRIQASGYSVADIRARTKAKDYDVIFVDYLQLVKAENQKALRYEQVTQISMDLHNLAQQLGVIVVALSQLSRPNADRTGRTGKVAPPTMRALRDSGQIEQDADVILLLSDSTLSDGEKRAGAQVPSGAELRLLQVAKNKNGQRHGGVHLLLYGETQRMIQLTVPGREPPPEPEFVQEFVELPDDSYNPFDPRTR